MIPVWKGPVLTLLSTVSMQERRLETTPVTVQIALARLRNNYSLVPFIKQERSSENIVPVVPDLKSPFQILTLKQYIYLVVSLKIENFLCASHFSLGLLNPYQHTDCRIALESIGAAAFPDFRICCLYAKVQVCREIKNSSNCWKSRRCKMPLSYLLS